MESGKLFPRGSVPSGAKKGLKRPAESNDVLFGASKRTKRIEVAPKKTGKPKTSQAAHPTLGLGVTLHQGNAKKPTRIDSINSHDLSPGSLVLGVVLSLTKDGVLVSLPGGNVGRVSYKELSDTQQSSSNQKGALAPVEKRQVVRCYVLGNDAENGGITLSLRCSLINRGLAFKHLQKGTSLCATIVSKEDHGYTLSTGIAGASFFLPDKETSSTGNVKKNVLAEGKLINCLVREANADSRTVSVRMADFRHEEPVRSTHLPFLAVTPGMLFDVVVDKIVDNGLLVSYLNLFHGAIDLVSLSSITNSDWKSDYSRGQILQARVVFVNHAAKLVRLSMRPHILLFRSAQTLPVLGEVVSGLTIRSIGKSNMILAAADAGEPVQKEAGDESSSSKNVRSNRIAELKMREHTVGYIITRNNIARQVAKADTTDSNAFSGYEVGTSIDSARVKGYHLVEGLVALSTVPSFLSGEVVHYSDVRPGERYKVVVKDILDTGLAVQIHGTVNAFCPLQHTSDIVVEGRLREKFKVGQTIRMRVWESNAGSILMTNKKSLVDMKGGEILTSADFTPGKRAVGIVEKISADGIGVRFFNDLHGTVAMATLARQSVLDPAADYRKGQIIKVIVLSTITKGSKLRAFLALDMNTDAESVQALIDSVCEPSQKADEHFLSGTIMKVEDDSVSIRLNDGRGAVVEKIQLFDFASTAATSVLKTGQALRRLWPLVMEGSNTLSLTAKPLLLHALQLQQQQQEEEDEKKPKEAILFPKDISELSPGQLVVGYVSKVESYGVVVKFQGNLSALAPRPNISDKFVSSPIGMFTVGDSVRCMVQRVDLAKGRIIVTLKASLVPPSSGEHCYLLSWLREAFTVAEVKAAAEQKLLPAWRAYPLGSVVSATVSSIESYGLVLIADDQSTLMLDRHFDLSSPIAVGETVAALVLDVDFDHCVLQVRVVPKESRTRKKAKLHHPILATGDMLSATVQCITPKYVVVADLSKKLVGFVPLADFHSPQPSSLEVAEGQELSLAVDYQSSDKSTPLFPHAHALVLRVVQPSGSARARAAGTLQDSTAAETADSKANKAIIRSNDEDDDDHDNVGANASERLLKRMKVGSKGKWLVKAVSAQNVQLAPLDAGLVDVISGFIDLSNSHQSYELQDHLSEKLQATVHDMERNGLHTLHPFASIKIGDKLFCQIVHTRDQNGQVVVQLRQCSATDASAGSDFHFILQKWGRDSVRCPSLCSAVVVSFDQLGCQLAISPYIRAHMSFVDVSRDMDIVKAFTKHCFVGMRLVVAVIHTSRSAGKVKVHVSRVVIENLIEAAAEGQDIFSISEKALEESIESSRALQPGAKVVGAVNLQTKHVVQPPAVMVALPGGRLGRICATELADPSEWKESPDLSHGSLVSCRVLECEAGKAIELSMRQSRLRGKAKHALVVDPLPSSGAVVSGFVSAIGDKGCFLRLSRTITGRVLLRDLADGFVEQPDKFLRVGQLVRARVKSVSGDFVQLSLRSSDVGGGLHASVLENLHDGDVVEGVVQRVLDMGVFVELRGLGAAAGGGGGVVGLARKDHALVDPRKSLVDEYSVGDVVRAKVLRVARESGKVALGLREEFFRSSTNIVAAPLSVPEIAEEGKPTVSSKKRSADQASLDVNRTQAKAADDDLGPLLWGMEANTTAATAALSMSDEDDEGTDDSGEEHSVKKRQERKDAQRKRDEAAIRERERMLAEGTAAPQQPEDFERLLLAEPNSSIIWIQYVAHYIKAADIEAARLLAQRALRTIHFRESDEKFNVWMCWLNLEYKYGSNASLEQTLKQAQSESNGKKVILAMAEIFEEARDYANCESLFTKALKKPQYKKSKKMWMALQRIQLKFGRVEEARATLKRSLQSLLQHKHVETISRFALAEFEYGSPDKARQYFEDLLEHYPKRTDLWHLYVDKEEKLNQINNARQLYERMIASNSTKRNMKLVFKKYLALEMRYGDEASQNAVKEKAKAYISKC